MRIEKINDRQIRCTLNEKDLKEREIEISELAYGSSKAKALFRDMIQLASYELGFQTDDEVPVMIEAIPLFPEALVIIITKTEEPDELDTRFSNFTEDSQWDAVQSDDDFYLEEMDEYHLEDEELFFSEDTASDEYISTNHVPLPTLDNAPPAQKKIMPDFISLPEALGMERKPETKKETTDVVFIFQFDSLEIVTKAAEQISPLYQGKSTLYKDNVNKKYYLLIYRSSNSTRTLNQICNIIYEYGTVVHTTGASPYYFEEHFRPLIGNQAIEKLISIL